MNPYLAVPLGHVDFIRALALQREIHQLVASGDLSNVLLLLEHEHVFTLGRRGRDVDILAGPDALSQLEVEVHHLDRGGEATYHGPGQLVGYPIVDLRKWGGGPIRYVRALEEVIISTLAEFGVAADAKDRPTGGWVGDSKIAAIGVKVSRGVTTHGFALNVAPDLSYFNHIVPCGIRGARVTSMAGQGLQVEVESVIPVVAEQFGRVFGWDVQWARLDDVTRRTDAAPAVASRAQSP